MCQSEETDDKKGVKLTHVGVSSMCECWRSRVLADNYDETFSLKHLLLEYYCHHGQDHPVSDISAFSSVQICLKNVFNLLK